jgi:hypothetical protein
MQACSATEPLQRFDFLGNGLVQLTGSNFCLDAGSNPANGIALKLWTCYPGLSQQTFSYPQGQGLFRTANSQFESPPCEICS